MLEDFEYKGDWFLPGTPSDKVFGTLTYLAGKQTTLEIIGSLKEEVNITPGDEVELAGQSFYNIILGYTTNGKSITLFKSFQSKRQIHFPSGKESSVLDVMFILVGAHLESKKELGFTKIKYQFHHFNEWLDINGIRMKGLSMNASRYNLTFKQPKSIAFPIDSKVKAVINFLPLIKGYGKSYSLELGQNAQLVIESLGSRIDLDNLLYYGAHFQDFLTLGAFEATYPISIWLETDLFQTQINNKLVNTSIKLYYNNPTPFSNKLKLTRDFLYNYTDIKPYFKKVIIKWYQNSEVLSPVNDLLLESFYQSGRFNVKMFLNIVHGLETFHRRVRKNTVVSDQVHTKRINEIKNAVPNHYLEWLSSRLIHSNEPSLHNRLELLIKEFNTNTFNKIVKDKDLLIKQTKDSRNYYTHFDPKMRKKALSGGQLNILSEKLKIILVSAILKENGFSKNLIEKLWERNEYRFFNHLFK